MFIAVGAGIGAIAAGSVAGGLTALGGAAVGGLAGSAVGSYKMGSDAASATKDAAGVQANAQIQALNYLKERESVPQQFREGALKNLGGLAGLEGGTGSQQDLINRAQASPLYSAIMGSQQAGEDSILRKAAATGGLRSGNVQGAMYQYNTDLQNQALLQSYNQQLQGLQGLAGLPSNANQIAQGMSDIGTTQAQGITGAAQAKQQGWQNSMDVLGGGFGTLLKYGVI